MLVRAGDRHGGNIGILGDIGIPGVVCARDGVAVGLANSDGNRAILRDIRVCPLRRQIQAHLREMRGGEGNLVICHRNLGQRYGLAIRDDISTDPVLVGSPLRRNRQGDSSLAAIGLTIHRGSHVIGDEFHTLVKNGLGILRLGDSQRQILAGLQIHRYADLQLRIRCRLGFGRFDRVGAGGCRGHFGEEGLVACLLSQRLDVRFDIGHVHVRTGIVAPDGVHAAIVCLIVAVRHIALAVLARHIALGPLRAIPAGGFVANHIVPLVVRIDNAEVLRCKRRRRSILVGAGIPIADNDIRIKILGRGLILIIEAIVKCHDSKAIALHHSGQAIDKGGVCRVLLRGHRSKAALVRRNVKVLAGAVLCKVRHILLHQCLYEGKACRVRGINCPVHAGAARSRRSVNNIQAQCLHPTNHRLKVTRCIEHGDDPNLFLPGIVDQLLHLGLGQLIGPGIIKFLVALLNGAGDLVTGIRRAIHFHGHVVQQEAQAIVAEG